MTRGACAVQKKSAVSGMSGIGATLPSQSRVVSARHRLFEFAGSYLLHAVAPDGSRPRSRLLLTVAEALAENLNLADRIDIFEIEQFIALNFYEPGKFAIEGRRVALTEFVTRYNEIVDEVETNPSLRIEFKT